MTTLGDVVRRDEDHPQGQRPPSAEAPPPPELTPGVVSTAYVAGGRSLRALAALGLFAVVVGRGLAPALPGTTAGIGRYIVLADRVASLLSQLFLIAGVTIAVRLILESVRHPRLGLGYRAATAPAAALVVVLVMMAASQALDPQISLAMAVSSTAMAIMALPTALTSARARAAGLVLATAALSSATQIAARAFAIHSSNQALTSLFLFSRGVATFALVLDILGIALVGIWLGARRWKWALAAAAAVVGASAFFAWAALKGSSYPAEAWQVIAARTLTAMTRHPAPLVLPHLRWMVEVLALFAAALAVAVPTRLPRLQAALALALLARASTDIPLLALCLVLAALIAGLHAAAPAPTPVLAVEAHPDKDAR